MKRIMVILLLSLMSLSPVVALTESVEGPETCGQCGMNRKMFAHSRMLIVYADGSVSGVCSLHCTATGLLTVGTKPVSSLMVADYFSKKLIDAKGATWVAGGSKSGVMTAEAKWAFARKEDAERFVEENGGIINTFDQVLNAAFKEVMDQVAEEMAIQEELNLPDRTLNSSD